MGGSLRYGSWDTRAEMNRTGECLLAVLAELKLPRRDWILVPLRLDGKTTETSHRKPTNKVSIPQATPAKKFTYTTSHRRSSSPCGKAEGKRQAPCRTETDAAKASRAHQGTKYSPCIHRTVSHNTVLTLPSFSVHAFPSRYLGPKKKKGKKRPEENRPGELNSGGPTSDVPTLDLSDHGGI